MEKHKLITIRRNGRHSDKGIKIEISDSLDRIEYLIETIKEQFPDINMGSNTKFYTNEGVELSDDTLVLIQKDDTVYFDPYGNRFDQNNILEQYEVIEQLGQGGFGSVNKARHKDTGMLVAIKYIDITECMYHASRVDEIYKEAQALKKLNHPNIIKLYHTLLWKNFVVLIMEYVGGGELTHYVAQKGPYGLTETEARDFFVQLTDAVNYCHNRFTIHRDLKPENVLLTDMETRKIKLIDFGISGNNYGKSKDTTTAGSLHVLPPEALEAQCVNAEASIDLWAMGVILYLLVYGVLPFRGATEKEIIKSITAKEVVFPKGKKRVSKSCIKLISALLNKNPKARIKMNDIYTNDWFTMPEEELKKIDEESKKLWETAVNEEKKVKFPPPDFGVKKHKTFGPMQKPHLIKGGSLKGKTGTSEFNPKSGLVSKPTIGKKPVGTIFRKQEGTSKSSTRVSKPI